MTEAPALLLDHGESPCEQGHKSVGMCRLEEPQNVSERWGAPSILEFSPGQCWPTQPCDPVAYRRFCSSDVAVQVLKFLYSFHVCSSASAKGSAFAMHSCCQHTPPWALEVSVGYGSSASQGCLGSWPGCQDHPSMPGSFCRRSFAPFEFGGTFCRAGSALSCCSEPPVLPAPIPSFWPAGPFIAFQISQAQNIRIGCSGTEAGISAWFDLFFSWVLRALDALLLPLCRSCLGILFLCLVALWSRAIPGRFTPLGKITFLFCSGVSFGVLVPLGRAAGTTPVLVWQSRGGSKPRSGSRGTAPRAFGRIGWLIHLLLCSVPRVVWNSPVGFPALTEIARFVPLGPTGCGVFLAAVPGVSAMTTPESQFPVRGIEDEVRPIPSATDPTYYGAPRLQVPWEEAGPLHSPAVVELSAGQVPVLPDDGAGWLGAYVHTPFYRSIAVACRLSASEGLHEAAELVRNYAGGVPPGFFQVVAPVTPQRYEAYCEFVRLPHIIRYHNSFDSAAVVFDLTRVGGRYFADVVPKLVGYDTFLARLRPFVDDDPEQYFVFVGLRKQPWQQGEPLSFRDGDAVILTRRADEPVQRFVASSLFGEVRAWGHPNQIPRQQVESGLCVIHGDQKHFVPDGHYAAGDKLPAIARAIGRNLHSVTTCCFPVQDLDFAGYTCRELFCAVDLPRPFADVLLEARRDHFTFCDTRPLGRFPTVVYTHHPVLHIPSLAAGHGLRLPPSYTIGIVGGRIVEDEVFVGGHSTLVMYALPREDVPPAVAASEDHEGRSPSSDREDNVHRRVRAQAHNPRGRGIRFSPGAAALAARGSSSESDGSNARVLGLTLFAPHYQPDYLALRVEEAEGTLEIAERVRLSCARLPVDYFDRVVPVEPLPDQGFGAYLAYTSLLEYNAMAAVVIDMRPVGGLRFATVLPTRLSYDALDQFLRVLLPRDVFSFDLFVGVRSYPMLEGSNMLLKHGMLLSVCHRNTLVRTSSTQEHLFANRESWRSTERMPRESATGGICLITTGEDRWHFSSQDYPGFNFVEAVECCLGAAEGSIRISVLSSAAFEELCPLAEGTGSPFADLCLHGKHCNDVAIIVRDPPTGEAQGGREVSEECFLFLDLRPLGVRPHGMRQIGTVWSIPSILAKVPFGIPPGFEVHIEGGRIDGLLLYADSGTTVIASLVPAAPADVFAGIVATAASGDEQQDPDGGPDGHAQGPTHGIPPDSSGTRPRSRSRDRSLRPATTASGYTNALHLLAKGVSALFRSGCGILQALHFHAFIKKSAPVSSKLVPSIVAFQPVWESHTFGVLGQALEFGIGNLVLFSRLGKVQQAAHQCKVLQEPTGSSPAEVQHLAHLRDLTLRLGGQWLQNGRLPFFVEGFDVDLDPDEVVSDADSDSGIHVGCVILKQGYSPEAFVVSLQLPCTVDEAEQVVQASRRAEDRRRFPTLTPIHPQPIAGNIAFAAAPEWAPLSSFQCLDTVSLDGRLWVRQVPDYVSRHELLHIAGVPLTTACDMYAGLDFVLIDNENPFHVFPGCRIAITPSGQPTLAPNSLGRLLCSREGWVPEARVPLARVLEDAYCVTVGQDFWLHFADPVRPMQYRRDIAARVGAPDGRIDIQAARPRPTNVELQGYRCRSVLAVSCRPRGASTNTGYHILVDGRPILEGWSTITLQQRYIHLDHLFEVLTVLSPPGWVPQLGLTSDGHGFVHLVAGQVIVAEFARSSDNTVDGPGSADHTGGSETSGVPTSSGPNRDSDGGPHAWQPFIAEEIDPVATSPDDHPEELVPFLIFAQEYWPELVVVPVVQPVNVHGVFASVANARQPAAHRRSPTLVAVFPQPCAQQACLLALPAWQYSGVGILIDCRVGSPRLFASIAPHFFTPDAILGLAGLHDARHLFVFHRDVPWPCPPGEQIFPEEGDVFTICPDPRRPWHYQDLGRLLASSSQWDCLPDLPGGEAGISWILSNGVHVAVPVASDNFAINNATVAESLDLTPGQFVVVPASPSITDHAHRGRSSQAVLFACTVEDYIPGGSNVRIPYILDLRPVLSRLLGMFAASGIVDIADIASFLLARCPAGHHLRLYGGSSQGDEGNHYRRVDPGEVITAEFQPDYLNVLPSNPAGSVIIRPPRDGGGESSHGDQGSERPSESSAASSRDAGTGGTRRSGPPRAHCCAADARHIVGLDAPGHDGQVFYLAHGIGGLTVTVRLAPFVFLAQVLGIVMWARSYLETCLVDGTCGVTPVFRRFSGRSFEFPASQLCTWLSCYWCRWHRVGIPEGQVGLGFCVVGLAGTASMSSAPSLPLDAALSL